MSTVLGWMAGEAGLDGAWDVTEAPGVQVLERDADESALPLPWTVVADGDEEGDDDFADGDADEFEDDDDYEESFDEFADDDEFEADDESDDDADDDDDL